MGVYNRPPPNVREVALARMRHSKHTFQRRKMRRPGLSATRAVCTSRGAQVSRVQAACGDKAECALVFATATINGTHLPGRGEVEQGTAHHRHQPVTEFYKDYHQLKQHLKNGPVSPSMLCTRLCRQVRIKLVGKWKPT